MIHFSSPSESLVAAIRISVANSLTGPLRNLAGLLGISNFLAVYTVQRGERASGRLIVPRESAQQLEAAIRAVGVWCHQASFGYRLGTDPVAGTHHSGSFTVSDRETTRAVLYFGLTEALARGAEQADLHEEHALLGQLFGYPACCVRAFGELEGDTEDKLPATVRDTGPFPALMNPVIPYLYPGWSLLFHFACSPACAASLLLSQGRLSLLRSLAAEAEAFAQLGSGIALYGETIGIGLVKDYSTAAHDEFDCDEITTRSEQTKAALANCCGSRMRLFGPHRFAFGERIFDASHQFAARFEATSCS